MRGGRQRGKQVERAGRKKLPKLLTMKGGRCGVRSESREAAGPYAARTEAQGRQGGGSGKRVGWRHRGGQRAKQWNEMLVEKCGRGQRPDKARTALIGQDKGPSVLGRRGVWLLYGMDM